MSPFTVNANTPTIIAVWASLWVVPHCQYLHLLPAIEEVRHLLPTPTPNMSATLKKLTLPWASRNRKKEKPWHTLFKIVLNAHLRKRTWWEQHVTLIPSCFCSWWASTFDVCWSEHVRHFTGRPCALTTGTTMDLFLASIHHSRLLLTAAKKLSIQFAHHKVLTAMGYSEKRTSFQLSCCCWLLRVRFSDPKMTLMRCWIWLVYLPFIDSKLMKSKGAETEQPLSPPWLKWWSVLPHCLHWTWPQRLE